MLGSDGAEALMVDDKVEARSVEALAEEDEERGRTEAVSMDGGL